MKYYEEIEDDSDYTKDLDIDVDVEMALEEISKLERQMDKINAYTRCLWESVIKDYINDSNNCYVLDVNDKYMYERFSDFVHSQNPIINSIKFKLNRLYEAM